jgi:hypothetical protein
MSLSPVAEALAPAMSGVLIGFVGTHAADDRIDPETIR